MNRNTYVMFAYKEYLPIRNELCAIGKVVLRGTRIVVPTILREHVLELAHEGHPGIVSIKIHLRSKVWWAGIDKCIERYCKSCYECQLPRNTNLPIAHNSFRIGKYSFYAIRCYCPLTRHFRTGRSSWSPLEARSISRVVIATRVDSVATILT
jgi:hypothetical protein